MCAAQAPRYQRPEILRLAHRDIGSFVPIAFEKVREAKH